MNCTNNHRNLVFPVFDGTCTISNVKWTSTLHESHPSCSSSQALVDYLLLQSNPVYHFLLSTFPLPRQTDTSIVIHPTQTFLPGSDFFVCLDVEQLVSHIVPLTNQLIPQSPLWLSIYFTNRMITCCRLSTLDRGPVSCPYFSTYFFVNRSQN